MERYFLIDKYNTYSDWDLILESKSIPKAEANTKYVTLDGMSGSLDLSESLTGEVSYKDRTISMTFFTNYGKRKDREDLIQGIAEAIHGKRVKIIEPDKPDFYLMGRPKIKSYSNNLAYASLTIEADCDPWSYALTETVRRVDLNGSDVTELVFNNRGVKTVCPEIKVTGAVKVIYRGVETSLVNGTYKISDIKLRQGSTVIGVSGTGSITFTYREATL